MFLVLSPLSPAPVPGDPPAVLPSTLDPLTREYTAPVKLALRTLGSGVDNFLNDNFDLALQQLEDTEATNLIAVPDYWLLYRARSLRAWANLPGALDAYRLLQTAHPLSVLAADASLELCEVLLESDKPAEVLDILDKLEPTGKILFLQGQALEGMGNRPGAANLYLRVFTDYVNSEAAGSAEEHLKLLSPGVLDKKENYRALLQRGENLVRAGRNREARSLLLRLTKLPAPDAYTSEKQYLLLAEADLRMRRISEALRYLQKVSAANPSLHVQAIYHEAVGNRRLGREKSFLAARDKALELYPQSPFTERLLYSVATYFDLENQAGAAGRAYRMLTQQFPDGTYTGRALWKLSLYSYIEGSYEEALQGFWKHLLSQPNAASSGASIFWMGRCYEKLDQPATASYLYQRTMELANRSYYGQQAEQAKAGLTYGSNHEQGSRWIDLSQLTGKLDQITIPTDSVAEPSKPAAQVIERARQLLQAELPQLALEELNRAIGIHSGENSLNYVQSHIHAGDEDYLRAIISLRRAFPGYSRRTITSLPQQVWELLFPQRHRDLVEAHAAKRSLDPNLVLGIIRQESAFQVSARSPANARGLMQILPSTGRDLAKQARIPRYSTSRLYDAGTNIALGTLHLSSLIKRYQGKLEFALAAYNAGHNRVNRWISELGEVDGETFVELIPISETRGYVKQVLTNKAIYTILAATTAESQN